jgi:hypothetical protein
MGDRELAELSRKAYRALAAIIGSPPPHLVASFRLWQYAPAGPQRSWAFFREGIHDPLGAGPLVRSAAWDRDGDLERLELGGRRRPRLDPTLVTTETALDASRLADFIKEAGRLKLPADRVARPYPTATPSEFGLEGFDTERRDGRRPNLHVEWNQEPPLQLEAVSHWAARVRAWVQQSLPRLNAT